MKIIKFDIKKYPFDKMVSNLYDYPLNELNDNMDKNNLYNNTKFTKENVGKDSDSIWHKIFYNKLIGMSQLRWSSFRYPSPKSKISNQ